MYRLPSGEEVYTRDEIQHLGRRVLLDMIAKYGTPSPGHERGARPPGHSEHVGWSYPGVRVYDNEPWHWPPKTKEESMALTQEQFQAALEIRDIVVSAIADAVHSFQEPINLDEDESRTVAEGIAENLFSQGYIAIEVVDGDR